MMKRTVRLHIRMSVPIVERSVFCIEFPFTWLIYDSKTKAIEKQKLLGLKPNIASIFESGIRSFICNRETETHRVSKS